MRVAFVEWPDGLEPWSEAWDAVAAAVEDAEPDVLVTPPLPFGPWLAASPRFDRAAADASVTLHGEGLRALRSLHLPAVVTSRPAWSGDRLTNEGVVVEGETLRLLHRKQVLADEEGWRELAWFRPGRGGFLTMDLLGVRVGMLFCTEAMFSEHARGYGADGAELIVVPRATPTVSPCQTAVTMAAIVSGSYVVSSSRAGRLDGGPSFHGGGLALAPDGTLLAATSPDHGLRVVEIDAASSRRQKARFPCYLAGRPTP